MHELMATERELLLNKIANDISALQKGEEIDSGLAADDLRVLFHAIGHELPLRALGERLRGELIDYVTVYHEGLVAAEGDDRDIKRLSNVLEYLETFEKRAQVAITMKREQLHALYRALAVLVDYEKFIEFMPLLDDMTKWVKEQG